MGHPAQADAPPVPSQRPSPGQVPPECAAVVGSCCCSFEVGFEGFEGLVDMVGGVFSVVVGWVLLEGEEVRPSEEGRGIDRDFR